MRFCWGFDEQKIAPPLGHGNGLMSWPYRNSIHWMQDQCLTMDHGKMPNLRRLFDEYHENITTQLPWWRDEIAPNAKLRARMWEGFEIFVGLDARLRSMPNYIDGMILVGDAAGLESTGLCDGVPCAWFSADIAADVAIEAIQANDFSAKFLDRYNQRIQAHPIIQWAITCNGRWNLRKAQESHDRKELRAMINYQFGPALLTHAGTPLLEGVFHWSRKDPTVTTKWLKMFLRYYYNWEHERFGGEKLPGQPKKRGALGINLVIFDFLVKVFSPLTWAAASLLEPLAVGVNPFIKVFRPVIEAMLRAGIKMEPLFNPLTRWMLDSVKQADPAIFNVRSKNYN